MFLIEFLLGDRILVAPVLKHSERKRNVYLPLGYWKDGNSNKTYIGPTWVKDYPAGLNILPHFIRLWPHALTHKTGAYAIPSLIIQ